MICSAREMHKRDDARVITRRSPTCAKNATGMRLPSNGGRSRDDRQ